MFKKGDFVEINAYGMKRWGYVTSYRYGYVYVRMSYNRYGPFPKRQNCSWQSRFLTLVEPKPPKKGYAKFISDVEART